MGEGAQPAERVMGRGKVIYTTTKDNEMQGTRPSTCQLRKQKPMKMILPYFLKVLRACVPVRAGRVQDRNAGPEGVPGEPLFVDERWFTLDSKRRS